MNKDAFMSGYIAKEAFGGIAAGVGKFGLQLAPPIGLDVVGSNMQDTEIAEYRKKLGLPPEETEEEISQKKLQEQATAGSVPITT